MNKWSKQFPYVTRRRNRIIESENRRIKEIGAVGGFAGVIFLTLCLVIVDVFSEWIDSKGQIIGFIMAMVGLAVFAYWALIGRK
jgi:drug/metabolite transporter (DMT)-like permease